MYPLTHLLLFPPALHLWLYLLGSAWRKRAPRLGRALQGGSMVLLYLLSTSSVANLLLDPLETRVPPAAPAARAAAQVIVVLTAGRSSYVPEYGPAARPDAVGMARALYAARLARDLHLPVLVSGGWGREAGFPRSLAEDMAEMLRTDLATPVRFLETGSSTTEENASGAARILFAHGLRHIVLVTDARHMSRACAAFARAGFVVEAAPTAYWGHTQGSIWPNITSLQRSHDALYEWLGLAWYALRAQVM